MSQNFDPEEVKRLRADVDELRVSVDTIAALIGKIMPLLPSLKHMFKNEVAGEGTINDAIPGKMLGTYTGSVVSNAPGKPDHNTI